MLLSKSRERLRAAALDAARDVDDEATKNREEAVTGDLTRRMKCVCGDLSTGDFEALVKDMTRVQLRGERVCGNRLRPC